MNEDEEVGTFMVDLTKRGEYRYTIFANDNVDAKKMPWALRDENDEYISVNINEDLHYRLVKGWIEGRVFPPERQDADKLLRNVGIEEYDQLMILKYTSGAHRHDAHWIKFKDGVSFKDVKIGRKV